MPDTFFRGTTGFLTEYSIIAAWAVSKSAYYLQNALSEFLNADEADAWLIAYALADLSNTILVTHETSQPNRKNKIKIPDVCIEHNIQYCNTIEMLRQLGERF